MNYSRVIKVVCFHIFNLTVSPLKRQNQLYLTSLKMLNFLENKIYLLFVIMAMVMLTYDWLKVKSVLIEYMTAYCLKA